VTDYALVLQKRFPNREWIMVGTDYDGLTFHDGAEPVSQAELDGLWPEIEADAVWDEVRGDRNALLAASDWTQVSDAPLTASEKQAWAAYRQTLRDIPQDFASPDDVTWPVAP